MSAIRLRTLAVLGATLGASLQPCFAVAADPAANPAPANGVNGNGTVPRPPVMPGMITPGGQNLTPEQMQAIMMYRALQTRGRGRVRTGVPQFIPLGGMGYNEQQFQQQQQLMNGALGGGGGATDPADTKKQDIKQRRIEARKAAEEKKRAAREAAKAKAKQKASAKALKANAADPAADADGAK